MSTFKERRKCSKCGDSTSLFHRFPKSDGLRATTWALYCWPDKDWSSKELLNLNRQNKVLCHKHFQDSMYLDISKTRLSKHSVPGTREEVHRLFLRTSEVSISSIVEQSRFLHGATRRLKGCGTVVHISKKFIIPEPGIPDGEVHSDHTYSCSDSQNTQILPVGNSSTSIAPIDLKPASDSDTHQLDNTLAESGVLVGLENLDHDDLPSSPAPEYFADNGDVAEIGDNIKIQVDSPRIEIIEEIFSWQKTELIETDDPEDQSSVLVPEDPKIPEDVDTILSMFCDDPETPVRVTSEPVVAVVPEDVEYGCKNCANIIDGFQYWCVQCALGALCGACASLDPHTGHHVLRAPKAATQSRTQAVLEVIRQQLLKENLLTHYEIDEDGVKVEVKQELDETPPSPAPAPDPLAVDDHTGIECINEETVEHHPFKRPRLMEFNRDITADSYAQRPLLQRPNTLKRPLSALSQDVLSNSTLESPIPSYHGGSQLQRTQPGDMRSDKNLRKGQPDELDKLRTLITRDVGQKATKELSRLHGNLIASELQETQTVKGISASVKVTSEPAPSETVIINLEDLVDGEIIFLDENILECGSEHDIVDKENQGRDRIEEIIDEESSQEVESETDDNEFDKENKNKEDYVIESEDNSEKETHNRSVVRNIVSKPHNNELNKENINEEYHDEESVTESEDNSEKETETRFTVQDLQSDIDDDLDKDYRIEEDRTEESDETDAEDIAERGVGRITRNAANKPVIGQSTVVQLTTEAVVQLRPLTSLEIIKWTTNTKRPRKD